MTEEVDPRSIRQYMVDDLQACEPESLTKDERVQVTLSDDLDSMGFRTAEVRAMDHDVLLEYVRENWGDDDSDWFANHVVARILTLSLVKMSVARSKTEILDDIDEGTVPAGVRGFSELHDYVDANVYGGLCDEWPSSEALGEDRWLAWGQAVQDEIHRWIEDGGLATARAVRLGPLPGSNPNRIRIATRAYMSVYEGPWGLKASEEDALLGILNAVYPEQFPRQDADAIKRIRGSHELTELVSVLDNIAQEGLTERETVKAFLPILDAYMHEGRIREHA